MSLIIAHGGAGHDEARRDVCELACASARAVLDAGGSARAAAIAAVVVMEDDPRLNAGTGSVLRVDGKTVQCDAAVMDLDGFGAVAGVSGVKNPVRLAEVVYGLPHLLVVGDGAETLAERAGLERAVLLTDERRAQHEDRLARRDDVELWRAGGGIDRVFAFALDAGEACDTVGACVRADDGSFGAAGSTGGLWCALRGRVGDTPIPGAGIDVSAAGAVCTTGVGEVIWRKRLASLVLRAMEQGASTVVAVEEALAGCDDRGAGVDIGIIAAGPDGVAARATRRMPWAAIH